MLLDRVWFSFLVFVSWTGYSFPGLLGCEFSWVGLHAPMRINKHEARVGYVYACMYVYCMYIFMCVWACVHIWCSKHSTDISWVQSWTGSQIEYSWTGYHIFLITLLNRVRVSVSAAHPHSITYGVITPSSPPPPPPPSPQCAVMTMYWRHTDHPYRPHTSIPAH